jgi:hypothetical protein
VKHLLDKADINCKFQDNCPPGSGRVVVVVVETAKSYQFSKIFFLQKYTSVTTTSYSTWKVSTKTVNFKSRENFTILIILHLIHIGLKFTEN